MKVVYNWLKDLVDISPRAEESPSALALAGPNVASVENPPHGPVIDAEITSNRPDCLGMLGIARELSAIYKVSLKQISPKPVASGSGNASDPIALKIEAPDICGRFTARVIRGVKVQPSPAWLKDRLVAMGQTSINNVVDATNYVMLELGQPMHAYDLDKLSGHEIIVRRATPKE